MFRFKERQEEKARSLQEKLEDEIILAEQVRNFFATDVGKYIQTKMDEDQQRVKNALVKVDADDIKAIRKLQMEYETVGKVKIYIGNALIAGNNAEKTLGLNKYEDQ